MNIKKLTLMFAMMVLLDLILLVGIVFAGSTLTAKLSLTKAQEDVLKDKGITSLNVYSYSYSNGNTEYKLVENKNAEKSLITIPKKVCDKYEQTTKIVYKPMYIAKINKTLSIPVIVRYKTGVCKTYRDLTSNEINLIVEKAFNKRIAEMTIVNSKDAGTKVDDVEVMK